MIILGVDPGTAITGYGIVRKEGAAVSHIVSGVVRTSAKWSQAERLLHVYACLDEKIQTLSPAVLAVESLFHAVNPQSLMKLCQVRGAILLLGAKRGMEICEYSPLEIKRGLTGYGRAEKSQMMFMVAKLLRLAPLSSPDEADALAIALYHAHVHVASEVWT
jgi:crossover junction endodeoxyribonuclease RuvC